MSFRVLIIESDPWLSDAFKTTLESEGYDVMSVSNAYGAIDTISDALPDVIVMGLILDGGASIALLHELQTYDDTAAIPVIVCTSSTAIGISQLEPYGVAKILDSKTMLPRELVASIRSILA